MSDTEDPVVANRRSRLKLWIDTNCDGSQKLFIASTNDGEKQINQGELSGLLRTKSFGEKRARALERQARMPLGYLDVGGALTTPAPISASERSTQSSEPWPFKKVTFKRLEKLKQKIGQQKYSMAIHDMDELLESAIIKWERREEIDNDKSAAA